MNVLVKGGNANLYRRQVWFRRRLGVPRQKTDIYAYPTVGTRSRRRQPWAVRRSMDDTQFSGLSTALGSRVRTRRAMDVSKQPKFGDPRRARRHTCAATATNRLDYVDVNNKRCAIDGCNGYPFGDPETTRCASAAKPLGPGSKRCAVDGIAIATDFRRHMGRRATHCCQHGTPLESTSTSLDPRCPHGHVRHPCVSHIYDGRPRNVF